MKLRCIVVEDEQPARVLMEDFINKVGFLELLGTFKNPLKAMTFLQEQTIDLVFLDIQMPDITGIELLKSLDRKPQVIFTTAYSEFALDGFELSATDYLLKPFSFNRFLQAANKASSLHRLKNDSATPSGANTLTIYADHKIYKVKTSELTYIEGLKEYVSYYTSDGRRIIALKALKDLEEELAPWGFIRVHRSYIVSIDKIETMEGNQLKIGDQYIPVGRSYKEAVMKKVFS